MLPGTQATLDQLRNAVWFSKVGVRDTEAAIVLRSWPEAMASCASAEWSNLLLEASNSYFERLAERTAEIHQKWNPTIERLKVVTSPFVREKVRRVAEENKLPKVFEDTVQWDILHLCMECEFADIYPVGFYASQAYWYVNGHFPCGWEGEFPKGKLIVY